MKRIEQWLLKHMPQLGCALYSYKHSRNKDYFKKAVQIDSYILKCDSYGNENPDKNLYYIELGEKNNGFFSVYHKLLKYLYYADRFHLTPVVHFTSDFVYAEDQPVNGISEPFEYYFIQPGGVSIQSAYNSRNVFKAEYVHTQIDDLMREKKNDYEVTDKYIGRLARISKKYIKLNEDIKRDIKRLIEEAGINDKTIGVHYRGTDFKRGLKNHPKMISLDEYEHNILELLEKGNYEKIFIATDSKEAIGFLKKRLSVKVICFEDTIRSSGNVSVAFSKSERSRHHYLLGFEVLRDMQALSECGAMIAGLSQVSLAARITKEARGKSYNDLRILSDGVVYNGAESKRYYNVYGRNR